MSYCDTCNGKLAFCLSQPAGAGARVAGLAAARGARRRESRPGGSRRPGRGAAAAGYSPRRVALVDPRAARGARCSYFVVYSLATLHGFRFSQAASGQEALGTRRARVERARALGWSPARYIYS